MNRISTSLKNIVFPKIGNSKIQLKSSSTDSSVRYYLEVMPFKTQISQNYFKKYVHLTFELAPYPGYSLP